MTCLSCGTHQSPAKNPFYCDACIDLNSRLGYGKKLNGGRSGGGKSEALVAYQQACEDLARDKAALQVERAQIASVLHAWRQAPLSIASLQPLYALADKLCGPLE